MNRAQRRRGLRAVPTPEPDAVDCIPLSSKSAERLMQLGHFAAGAEAVARAAMQAAQAAQERLRAASDAIIEAAGGEPDGTWRVDFGKLELRRPPTPAAKPKAQTQPQAEEAPDAVPTGQSQ